MMLRMFSCVEAEDVLTLTRTRIDCSKMLTALHLPNGGNYSILLDSVIRDFFFGCFGFACCCGSSGRVCYRLVFRHVNGEGLLINYSLGQLFAAQILAHGFAVTQAYSGHRVTLRRSSANRRRTFAP